MPQTNSGISWLDGAVLVGYFVGITLMGLWVSRKVKSSGGYFLGDRKLRWWIMMGQAFGTGTHAEQPVAQTGATCELGFATIWYQWKNMLITPFYWLMAPWYRRSERTTIGEIIEDRYGRKLALLYTVFAIAYFVFNQGAMLKGAGKVISIATGGQVISPNGVVFFMTVAFLAYSFFGGLIASAYTDFVQSFLIIVLSFLLIPRGLAVVGGFTGMRAELPPDFFNLYSEVSGLDAFTIAMLAVNGLVGIVAQPHMLSMCATGNNERAGRIGQTYGSMVKRFCTIGWALTGLIVAAMLIKSGKTLPEREAAFGFACRELLGPGLVGLMIACVLAANMSTCSNFMVNTGALFTRNLYNEYINPGADDRSLLLMGRISGLLLTLLGVVFALTVDKVLDAFLFTETIAAFMGIMFLGGVLWKRANRQGALAATLTTFAVYYAINFQVAGELKLVYKWTPEPFGWAMLAGLIALIAVSMATKAEDSCRIAAFFEKLRYSSDDDALTPDGRRILARDRGEDLLLLDLPGWLHAGRWRGFCRRYREDLIGFGLGWVTVVLLIGAAWGLMQIGR
ncbi:MAG: sodium:solute symporter family protein [Candidatus Hydrogenedentes bacterium]|nr:sodium:solute symporter family protein [Candidatus Hydrogenedentota bacterium]